MWSHKRVTYYAARFLGLCALSLVNVLCCQVEVFAIDPFLFQRSPTTLCVCVNECGKV
jgi:hypothetical protein